MMMRLYDKYHSGPTGSIVYAISSFSSGQYFRLNALSLVGASPVTQRDGFFLNTTASDGMNLYSVELRLGVPHAQDGSVRQISTSIEHDAKATKSDGTAQTPPGYLTDPISALPLSLNQITAAKQIFFLGRHDRF
jgi:hypothetical protein